MSQEGWKIEGVPVPSNDPELIQLELDDRIQKAVIALLEKSKN